ncbi:MAG TPA: lytic transglycosylase domain-containing protein, partial [Chroococcales cyanobacterium]
EWSAGLPPEEAALIAGAGASVALPSVGGELFFLRQYKEIERLAKEKSLIGWLKALRGDHNGAIKNAGGDPHLLYPLGYRPFLLEACREKNLNPLLLAALVREESRFDPRAVSPVGAVGLAQLMPSTSKGLDGSMGELKDRPLTDPRANLGRGALYLSYSRLCFPGRDYLAVAGYNAGTGSVKGWTTRFAGVLDDPDCFIESIPFRETRDYVRRVFASYWNYRELYVGTNP